MAKKAANENKTPAHAAAEFVVVNDNDKDYVDEEIIVEEMEK